ncbi:ABC transporter ATP-binding protein [Mesoterricola silvestris]|uniref:ABC transporter n=1 Tax=Mesoterricola silvestris TaxID=2927979 RepID=A0AA48GN93_9BACT|nr:ABC transporter ATP-binding protein [Mesoterricola silvestris]BDU70937.1 ABC transporter [Mesoterricola silvestris]
MTALLRAEGIRVRRGAVTVLDLPTLELEAGGVLALIGPNGSGKSTLLKTLACLMESAEGSLAFRGETLRPEAYRRRVTMVFQAPLLFDTTVRANLESGLKLHGVPGPERATRVAEMAARFGVDHLLDRSARNLSGGEAQRAALARAFVLRPEILFLDEPFSALDPPTREALLDDLAAVLRETRTTTIIATHDQMEALRLADRIAVLREGRVVQCGPALDVINRPVDAFVADFVGMETVLAGRVEGSGHGEFRVGTGGGAVVAAGEAPLDDEVRIGIRPENVVLTAPPGGPTSARNRFDGTVTRIVPKGPFFKVELDCGFFLAAYVTPVSLEELALAEGSRVVATFKATAVHLLRK